MDESVFSTASAMELTLPPAGAPYHVADVDWRKWGYPYPLVPENDIQTKPVQEDTPVYPDVEWTKDGEILKRAC